MITGLDSSADRPTPAQVAQAWQGGVRLWGGYAATRPNVGLAAPWDRAAFDVARTLGSTPLAFCSGWDDPLALRTLAQQWRVRLCLDVEAGIRGDGPWVDSFLAASGAGLYGQHSPLGSVHYHAAPFHVGAYYPGADPGTAWYGTRPADGTPCGWQWQGSHTEFGLSVDRGWYDDWFRSGGKTTMLRLKTATSDAQYLLSGRLLAFIPDLASAQALETAGVPLATVSDAFLGNVQAAAAPGTASGAVSGTLAVTGQLTVK